MRFAVPALMFAIAAATPARAEPFYFSYEGDALPETVGWIRQWGNRDGIFQGPGASRSIENGLLHMDSLADSSIFDFYEWYRPGRIDPGLGELFQVEWRVDVRQTIGFGDQSLVINSDDGNLVAFKILEDEIVAELSLASASFAPGPHEFRVYSEDMLTFFLEIDGQLRMTESALDHATPSSRIAFGDGVQGSSSISEWDYVRFGVVPEPGGALMLVILGGVVRGRR